MAEGERGGVRVHDLKCDPVHFVGVRDGTKPFECRLDDRGYAVGDVLLLREYLREVGYYTGNVCERVVTSILRDTQGPWLAPGYVCLGLAPAAEQDAEGVLRDAKVEVTQRAIRAEHEAGRLRRLLGRAEAALGGLLDGMADADMKAPHAAILIYADVKAGLSPRSALAGAGEREGAK